MRIVVGVCAVRVSGGHLVGPPGRRVGGAGVSRVASRRALSGASTARATSEVTGAVATSRHPRRGARRGRGGPRTVGRARDAGRGGRAVVDGDFLRDQGAPILTRHVLSTARLAMPKGWLNVAAHASPSSPPQRPEPANVDTSPRSVTRRMRWLPWGGREVARSKPVTWIFFGGEGGVHTVSYRTTIRPTWDQSMQWRSRARRWTVLGRVDDLRDVPAAWLLNARESDRMSRALKARDVNVRPTLARVF